MKEMSLAHHTVPSLMLSPPPGSLVEGGGFHSSAAVPSFHVGVN